ncbi:MAG TPA: hypothetical protein DDW22_05605 [Prevotellaceae bacterium]|nr:hypothetical protein [Prevotellaceae bacterium]
MANEVLLIIWHMHVLVLQVLTHWPYGQLLLLVPRLFNRGHAPVLLRVQADGSRMQGAQAVP